MHEQKTVLGWSIGVARAGSKPTLLAAFNYGQQGRGLRAEGANAPAFSLIKSVCAVVQGSVAYQNDDMNPTRQENLILIWYL